jgi:hypothetical protein
MAHESSITSDPNDNSFTRARQRKLETFLVVLVFLWVVLVFGLVIYVAILNADNAAKYVPTAIPTPK